MPDARTAVSTPHPLATKAAEAVLTEGGTAVEALVAASAVCAVVAPHRTGLGGDGLWMLAGPEAGAPEIIESVGRAGLACHAAGFRAEGLDAVPERGPRAVLTPPGNVAGWAAALAADEGSQPLSRLLAGALALAADGAPVSDDLRRGLTAMTDFTAAWPGFHETLKIDGDTLRQPALAATLERLAEAGLGDLYTGEIAHALTQDLASAGCPLSAEDLAGHAARRAEPLSVASRRGRLWAPPPPSQGLVLLMMLGLFERLTVPGPDGFDHLHGMIEAAKQAALVRDAALGDPEAMTVDAASFLAPMDLAMRASDIVPNLALGWPVEAAPGDTVVLAAVDAAGRMACTVQSLGMMFGAGVVSPLTGLILHNRGHAFTLDPDSPRALAPGRRPVHALCPLLADLKDGRRLLLAGTGGDAAPQTAAQVTARLAMFGADLKTAATAPRLRLGKRDAADTDDVKVEAGTDPRLIDALRAAGHAVTEVDRAAEATGQIGAVLREADGTCVAAEG